MLEKNITLTNTHLLCSGGIVFWADTIGADRIYKSLKKWSELYGNFFKPSRYLEERANRGIPLVIIILSFCHVILLPIQLSPKFFVHKKEKNITCIMVVYRL